jgi:hypothetical protein
VDVFSAKVKSVNKGPIVQCTIAAWMGCFHHIKVVLKILRVSKPTIELPHGIETQHTALSQNTSLQPHCATPTHDNRGCQGRRDCAALDPGIMCATPSPAVACAETTAHWLQLLPAATATTTQSLSYTNTASSLLMYGQGSGFSPVICCQTCPWGHAIQIRAAAAAILHLPGHALAFALQQCNRQPVQI